MDYLLKSSALFLLMYLGYTLFLKKETFFNHNRWFLLVGVITAAILPCIEIPVYIPVEISTNTETVFQLQYIPNKIITNEPTFEWQQLITYIYLAGVIIFAIQFLFQFGSLVVLLLKNSKNKEGIYTYVIVKNKISPFSFFKWIVYNPNLFSNEELQLILNHEKVHVRQWHSLDIIISRLACVAFWFNPISWLYHKSIQQNLEYIADDKTQKTSVSEKNYQALLLKTSMGDTNINLTSNFYNSLIKKRIIMLQKNRSKSVNRWKSLLVIPFFALFLMSFNTKEVLVEIPAIDNEINSTESKSIEVYFSKETTDEDLKETKKKLKAEGVLMTIEEKKRNANGLLTILNLTFKYDGSTANYWANDKNGIKSFYFRKKDNGAIAVGPLEIIEVVEEQEVIEIIEEPIIEVIEEENEHEAIVKEQNNTFIIRTNPAEIESDSIVIETRPIVKGKYSFYTTDSVVVGAPTKLTGKVKVNSNYFTIKTDSVNYKNVVKVRNTKGTNPIYVINGKVVSQKDLKRMNPNKISEVNVIKGKKATTLYGKKGKDGVVEIITNGKANKNNWQISKIGVTDVFKTSTKDELKKFLSSNKKPLIAINGDILTDVNTDKIDYSIIESISIVDDSKATEMYGDRGKNGIVVITTNEGKQKFNRLIKSNEDYKVQIGSVRYEDNSKNSEMTLYFITKDTPDNLMNSHKEELAAKGITVKYSKMKRNKDGEIVRLKISVKDEDGNSSVATFNNSKGIPTINFGKFGDNLVVSSKPF